MLRMYNMKRGEKCGSQVEEDRKYCDRITLTSLLSYLKATKDQELMVSSEKYATQLAPCSRRDATLFSPSLVIYSSPGTAHPN